MTSFIERRVNEVCGRWLDGFNKDNVEISLLQAKITLSDLHFKTDELRLLSPALAPSSLYVGQLSVDIPLTFNLNRPLKIAVSDVLAVVRVGDHHGMVPEDARRTISANVHVKALLSRLAAELRGGFDNRGLEDYARKISARTVGAVHKVVQNMEMSVKGVHMRLEQSEGASEGGNGVALGVCLREISLGPDARARARTTKAGGDGKKESRGQWIGDKFRKMETEMFGDVSRYDCPKFDDIEDPREMDETSYSKETGSAAMLMIAKVASVRGLLVYFCQDKESYSANDREKTLLRLKEGLNTPPDTLPPLLDRCRAGLGLTVSLSASQWDKMHSLDVRILVGDVNIQVSDDHIVYLLKWLQELDGYKRTLALNAVRPVEESVMPTRPNSNRKGGDDGAKKSRFYHALWRYAVQVVMRDLRSSLEQRAQLAFMQLRWSHRESQTTKTVDGLPWSSEEHEYRVTRGLLWRMWLGEWVRAARYVSLRELIQPWLVVQQFRDQAGVVHEKLHEDLHVEAKGREGYCEEETTARKLAKYSMPWQLPQEDVDEAWELVTRKCLRWEMRHARGVGAAMQEEREDVERLRPAVLQALWSIQLQMDAQLPPRICATSRGMATLRVGLRHRIDCLWQARAEKQRRLRLGLVDLPSTSPRSTAFSLSDVNSTSPSEYGETLTTDTSRMPQGENITEDADHVGTLLVRMGQLDGVGGVGLLSLTPKAVATLVLEESSASVEEMNMETNTTKVATYDDRNQRCFWDEIFRLEVELDESYVQQLRRDRQRKRRASSDAPAKDMISSPISSSPEAIHSPRKSYRPKVIVTDGTNAPEVRCSSFLLAVSCFDTRLFGITQLGVTTLSSKQLTAVPLKAMEHRCALFSPVAVDQQPRELTFHTIFVPPGDDVARGEQDLKAISESKRLHEIVGMENRGVSSVGRQLPSKAKGSVASISSTSEPADKPPKRTPLDNVGEREVKVLPLVTFTEDSLTLDSGGSTPEKHQGDLMPTYDARSKYTMSTNSSCFPVVETSIPRLIAVSVRVVSLKVGTYLNVTAALARATRSDTRTPEQDRMEALTEVLATEIEVCGDVNLGTGKIAARIGAKTVDLRDKSLLKENRPSSVEADVQQPQLMRAGPLGLEISAALLTSPSIERGAPENSQECVDKPLSMAGRSLRETLEMPTEMLERWFGREPLGNGAGSSKEKRFWDALGSMDKWSFDGRLILGRFTAELGRWRGGKVAEEVWKRFRFMVSHRSLESTVQDTQILRGARTDVSGMVTSTAWLLRAGSTSLSLDVEVPQQWPSAQSRSVFAPESPTWSLDVSSSESESESDTSTTGVLRRDKAHGTKNRGSTPCNPRAGSLRFPSTFNTEGEEVKARHPQTSFNHFGVERSIAEETLDESLDPKSDGAVMGLDFMTMTKAELIRRVNELEAEVATLKQAAVSGVSFGVEAQES